MPLEIPGEHERNLERTRVPFATSAWRAGVRGRCPHCGETSMFAGYYTLHERCARCDLRYEAESGAWLGALALGYGIGALVAIGLAILELTLEPIRALGLPVMWTVAIAALLATLVGYRPAKAVWFTLLYHFGFMAYGDAPPGPPPRASEGPPEPPDGVADPDDRERV